MLSFKRFCFLPAALFAFAVLLLSTGCSTELEAFPEQYVGIGVELYMETAGAKVVRVLEGGPAAAADFKAGDLILQADGELLRGLTLAQVVNRLRDAPNTKLDLLVHTKAGKDEHKTLIRRAIKR